MIRSQQRSAAGGDVFLTCEVEAIDGVGGNPEEKAEQGIGEEPEDIGEGSERADGGPEKESKRAKVKDAFGNVVDQRRRKNTDKREKISRGKNASTMLLFGTMLQEGADRHNEEPAEKSQ